jgi:hypothetical protein
MSAIKGKKRNKTILVVKSKLLSVLDIESKLNKLRIGKLSYLDSNKELIFTENDIIVGMYKIRLCFTFLDLFNNHKTLKSNSKFKIQIFESNNQGDKEIFISDDTRFKSIIDAKYNDKYKLSIKDLSNIVYHCNKLDSLKMFL